MTKKTIDLPFTPKIFTSEWRCAGCGIVSPDRARSCSCPTDVVVKDGMQEWKRGAGADAPREALAQFMIRHSFATGHGDTHDSLLAELSWQIDELMKRARSYLAINAAESGADVLIAQLADALEPSARRMKTMSDLVKRPRDSNADAWHLFLSEYLDARANIPNGLTFMAVQIAEAIDDAAREQCEAKDAEIARLKARLFPPDCPPADQERDHLAEQCATLGKENASFSTENERLRAKLDRAKEAFGPLIKAASRLAVAAQTTGGVAGRDEGLCAEIDRLAQPLGKARSVLSELSADAPAQQPQISDEAVEDDDKLRPCPFCGGEAEEIYIEEEGDNFGGSCICCKTCGASSAVHFDRKENLRSSWNARRWDYAALNAPATQISDDVRALLDEAIAALETAHKALDHEVPEQCWATGPSTGDPFQDLIVCPGCAANSKIDATIAKLRAARNA